MSRHAAPIRRVETSGRELCIWHGDEVPVTRCAECLQLHSEVAAAPTVMVGGLR